MIYIDLKFKENMVSNLVKDINEKEVLLVVEELLEFGDDILRGKCWY